MPAQFRTTHIELADGVTRRFREAAVSWIALTGPDLWRRSLIAAGHTEAETDAALDQIPVSATDLHAAINAAISGTNPV